MRRIAFVCAGFAYIAHGRQPIGLKNLPHDVGDTTHALSSILLVLNPAAAGRLAHARAHLQSSRLLWTTPHIAHSSLGNRVSGHGSVMSEISSDRPLISEKVEPAEWSPVRRNVFLSVALAGALLTASLTLDKTLGTTLVSRFCTSETCGVVLGGPFGNIAGVPLTAFGAIAYLTAAILAFFQDDAELRKTLESEVDNLPAVSLKQLLLVVVTGMAIFSGYLMVLLGVVIKASCTYCIFSAAFSASLCALAWWGSFSSDTSVDTGKRAAVFGSVAALLHFFSGAYNQAKGLDEMPKRAPEITTKSSDRAMVIAENLRSLNATMYGAYWCSHCLRQKINLGKEAMKKLRYVECAEDAEVSQRPLCEAIKGYPTWIINGETFQGEQTFEEFEEIIGRMKK